MIRTSHRLIKTVMPHPKAIKALEYLKTIEPPNMQNYLPVLWKRARDASVWDEFGNKFIDFTSAIFVTNSGHGRIAGNLIKQAQELIHCYTFPSEVRVRFLKILSQFLPTFCDKIYLASAGSEVTSWALKCMRSIDPNRQIIISFTGAFHGKTGDIAKLETEEIKLPEPISVEDWENHIELIEPYKDKICGVIIESYQGWSGKFLPEEYVQKLVTYCHQNNIAVCFDEIQAGFYRTGKRFAYEWYNVNPDLLCLGKALGGGYPLSALVGRAKYFNVAGMSSTHSATPLACAVGYGIICSYDKTNLTLLTDKSTFLNEYLRELQAEYPDMIEAVNSRGLLAGVIFKDFSKGLAKEIADEVCWKCMQNGLLLVHTGKRSVKIGPPLNINKYALVEGLEVLEKVIREVYNVCKSN